MSTLKVGTIQNAAGVTQYLCKAWVLFDGTGTPAIRASGNVSSITDNGVGEYAVNFTNAFSDANYCGVTAVRQSGVALMSTPKGELATISALPIATFTSAGSSTDATHITVTVFR